MAESKADWSVLRGPFTVFAVCLIASAAMIAASLHFRQSMEREYQQNHARFRTASQQYLAVDEEERMIEDFYPEFVRLYRDGLLGKERRLSWLESLRHAGEAIKIPELSYKLEAQREIAPEFPLTLGTYSLFVSPMNLTLGLLHEGDLLQLLQALDREALGEYSVKSCNLKRRSIELNLNAVEPNISAECQLDWWTVDLAGERELEL
jgi:hypothetical protein